MVQKPLLYFTLHFERECYCMFSEIGHGWCNLWWSCSIPHPSSLNRLTTRYRWSDVDAVTDLPHNLHYPTTTVATITNSWNTLSIRDALFAKCFECAVREVTAMATYFERICGHKFHLFSLLLQFGYGVNTGRFVAFSLYPCVDVECISCWQQLVVDRGWWAGWCNLHRVSVWLSFFNVRSLIPASANVYGVFPAVSCTITSWFTCELEEFSCCSNFSTCKCRFWSQEEECCWHEMENLM